MQQDSSMQQQEQHSGKHTESGESSLPSASRPGEAILKQWQGEAEGASGDGSRLPSVSLPKSVSNGAVDQGGGLRADFHPRLILDLRM